MRIPRALAMGAGLRPGAAVEISADGDAIVIRPGHRPRYRLSELRKLVKRSNIHAEVDSGPPVGREAV